MMKTALNDLNPFTIGTTDVVKAAATTASYAKFDQAPAYAAGKGPTSPYQPSVFRGLLQQTKLWQTVADYAPLIGVVTALGNGLYAEFGAMNQGQCQ